MFENKIFLVFVVSQILLYPTNAVQKCGPKGLCECSAVSDSDVDSVFLMNCEAMDGRNAGLEDICNSINATYTNVTHLHAGRNNFGNIHPNMTSGCWNLTTLDLHYNQITDLTSGAFLLFKHLETLDLSDNDLRVYEKGQFNASELPTSLETLFLTGNPQPDNQATKAVTYPSLSVLTNLRNLYIDGIQADFGPEYSRTTIRSLSLATRGMRGNCTLRQLFNTTLATLTAIEELNLSRCDLENIHRHAFSKLSNLTKLDLSLNRRLGFSPLENITQSLQFTRIQELNYSSVYPTFGIGTQLLMKDVCYLRNTTLKKLSFNGNRLEQFETNAPILFPKQIEELYFMDNRFTFGLYLLQVGCVSSTVSIDASFQNKVHPPYYYLAQPKVQCDLGRNTTSETDCPYMTEESLRNISKELKGLCTYFYSNDTTPRIEAFIPHKVKTIVFRDSNMRYNVQVDVRMTPKDNLIEYMDFSGNVFHLLTGTVGPFPRLKYLAFSRCYCSWIGTDFLVSTIETLHLDQNYLGEMFATKYGLEAINKLVNLKLLNLSTNGINSLWPDLFRHQEKLETLDLSFNNIENLNLTVGNLTKLRTLNLQHNSIHMLQRHLRHLLVDNADRTRQPFQVDLRNNSITYSCDNLHFLQWLYKYRANMTKFSEIVFVGEGGQLISADTFLAEIHNFPRKCKTYTWEIVVGSVGVFVFVCITVGALVYKKRWKLQYLFYMTKKRYFGYRRLEDDTVYEIYKYDAFISYSDDNIRFIQDKVIPELEGKQLRLCVHQRDFLPGMPISDNIIEAIQTSRRTVVLLCNSFLKKKWCIYEFNMARMESIYKREENGSL